MPDPARPLGTDDADDLRLYLEAAAREPLLKKEDEVELAILIETGKAAEEKLAGGRLRSDPALVAAIFSLYGECSIARFNDVRVPTA